MPSILFVDWSNRFRSPLAAACLLQRASSLNLEGDCHIESAGTWAVQGQPAEPSPGWVAANFGLDVQEHSSRPVNREMLERCDLVLVMEASQKRTLEIEFPHSAPKIMLLSEISQGSAYNIPEPTANQYRSYLEVGKKIVQLVTDGFDQICARVLQLRDYSEIS
jgi:protein-tyrosine-phosphatase